MNKNSIENNTRFNVGAQLIVLYFSIAYIIPLIFNIAFKDKIKSIYFIHELTLPPIVFAIVLVFLVWILAKTKLFNSMAQFKFEKLNLIFRLYLNVRIYFSVFVFLFALINLYLGYNPYRYFSVAISEINSPVLLLSIVLNNIVLVDLFYNIFVKKQTRIITFSKIHIENILLSGSLIVFADGTGSLILALIAFSFGLVPSVIFGVLNGKTTNTKFNIKKGTSIVAFFLVLICLAWAGGETIKHFSLFKTPFSNPSPIFDIRMEPSNPVALENQISADKAIAQVSFIKRIFLNYFYYVVERISIFYYSFLYSVNSPIDLKGMDSSPIWVPFNSLLFRANYLLFNSFDFKKPEITSFCQLNYRLLTQHQPNYSTRLGSAPGLLASFNYTFGFPFGMIFCALYLSLLLAFFNHLFRYRKFSIWGLLLLINYVTIFFDSPFDLLIILDNGFIRVSMLVLCCFVDQEKAHARENDWNVEASSHSKLIKTT